MRSRIVLYTAVYGDYETPKPIRIAPNVVPCIMITDSDVVAEKAQAIGWSPLVVKHYITTLKGSPQIVGPMLAHKWWKTHPHLVSPQAEISLWIDGSMEITVDDYVQRALDALGDDDWACVPHPARNCIYPEASFSATLARYDAPSIQAQAHFYRERVGHPPNWGLVATGANVRRHTDSVIELSEQWWDECINWSHQDQLSLPVLFRLNEGKVRWNMNLPWHRDWILHHHG
jgi:hypothetical protein